MDIQFHRASPLEGVITIQLYPSDYQLIVLKKAKDYSKSMRIKGFRPGHVPIQFIQKKFGTSILIEEIHNIVRKSLSDYIAEHKIDLFGKPVPRLNEKDTIDWEKKTEFEFSFDIGLVDPISLEPINEAIKINNYQVDTVEEALIDIFIKKIQIKNAAMQNFQGKSTVVHVIQGYLGELDYSSRGEKIASDGWKVNKDDAIEIMIPIFNLKEAYQQCFVGLSEGEQIIIKRSTLDAINEEVIGLVPGCFERFLISKKKDFGFIVNAISQVTLPKIEKTFFDKVLGNEVVHSEEEFRNKLEKIIIQDAQRDADNLFDIVLQDLLLKMIPIQLPEEFIKKVVQQMKDDLFDGEIEKIEKEYTDFQNYLKWDILLNKVLEINQISVSYTEVLQYIKLLSQFDSLVHGDYERFMDFIGRHGGGDMLNSLDKNQARIYKRCHEVLSTMKALNWVKDKITIEKSSMSVGTFIQKKKVYLQSAVS